MTSPRTALVTGASSGIGAATARWLASDGWQLILAARRLDRLESLATELGGRAIACDITSAEQVAALPEVVGGRLDLLVNNAGGAFGQEPLAEADLDQWQQMYDVNVLGTARVTQALLPALVASQGCVVFVTSTAAEAPYEGGAGYNAAKFGLRGLTRALRREEADNLIRVTEIDPGRVETDFALNRLEDEERAAAVYEGKLNLTAEDIAETVRWVASMPAHVNIDTLSIMPLDQAER